MTNPESLEIRTFNVGFGDCFLLSFVYSDERRHILIDCGSMKYPEGQKGLMKKVAEAIRDETSGKLQVMVVTHRHKDHLSGFNSSGSGNILESLAPDMLVQPWTEDPDIPEDAREPATQSEAHRKRLSFMNMVAASVAESSGAKARQHLADVDRAKFKRLQFLGEDNISNKKAITRLIRIGEQENCQAIYAHADMRLNLTDILPGVEIDILGPPTPEQHEAVDRQRSRHEDEFWQLHAVAAANLSNTKGDPFPDHPNVQTGIDTKWFCHRLKGLELDRLYQIVRILDDAMNNTSLILLIRSGDKSFLFPGDAQFENWEYTLNNPEMMEKLSSVDVYKVGHHGSLNATPKTLWKSFKKKGAANKKDRLTTLLSTLAHTHGHEDANTEVPRRTLVDQLASKSELRSTEHLPSGVRYDLVKIHLTS